MHNAVTVALFSHHLLVQLRGRSAEKHNAGDILLQYAAKVHSQLLFCSARNQLYRSITCIEEGASPQLASKLKLALHVLLIIARGESVSGRYLDCMQYIHCCGHWSKCAQATRLDNAQECQ